MIPLADIFKDGIDGTMISQWPCKRKFYNRFIRGFDNPTPSIAIQFGCAIDTVLEKYFKRELDEAQCIELFKSTYVDEGTDDRRTTERGETILKLYFKTFPRETDPFEVIAVQEAFRVDIGAMVPFCGKPDLVIRDTITGEFMPMDNKTTTAYGDSFADKYEIDTATEGYIYYVREKHGKCFQKMLNVLVPQKTKPRCDRFLVNKSDEQLDFWKKRTARLINEIVTFVNANYGDVDAFTLSDSRCMDFNSRCSYFDLCKHCDNLSIVKGDFVERGWSPFRPSTR